MGRVLENNPNSVKLTFISENIRGKREGGVWCYPLYFPFYYFECVSTLVVNMKLLNYSSTQSIGANSDITTIIKMTNFSLEILKVN